MIYLFDHLCIYTAYIFVCQYALSKLVFIFVLWSFHPHHYPHYPHGHHYHDHGHKVIIMIILIILRIPHHFYPARHTSSFDMVPMLEVLQVSEKSSTAHAFTAWDFLWSPKLGMWQSRCLEFVAYSFCPSILELRKKDVESNGWQSVFLFLWFQKETSELLLRKTVSKHRIKKDRWPWDSRDGTINLSSDQNWLVIWWYLL